MAITPADIRTRFPEFADTTEYPDARIQLFIDDATIFMGTDEDYWCGAAYYNRALAYLTAHNIVIGEQSEAGDISPVKSVNSATVEGVGVTFGAEFLADIDLVTRQFLGTTYGSVFIQYLYQVFPKVAVTGKR